MSKKNLMIIYWDLGPGGIQKRIRDLIIEMSQHYKDWTVNIFLYRKAKEGFDNQIRMDERISVKYFPYSGPLPMRIGYICWISWHILRLKPQVILTFLHVMSPVIIILKQILWWIPARVVLNEGIVTSYHLALGHENIFPLFVRLTYPHADMIIVPTRACKDDLVKHYSVPAGKISVIPNWTCLSPVKPATPIFDILYIGRFHPEKNPLTMVDIARLLVVRYPDIRVGMMGTGELVNDLRQAIRLNNLSRIIRVLPFSQDIVSILRRSKILVVPSFAEGMPNVVLEAAMCGVPAVVNRFPGADEVIRHGTTGYIYGTVKDAVNHIDDLLTHKQERRRMGKLAERYVAGAFSYKTQKRFIKEVLSEQ